jgi:hypothetical protein
MKLRISFCTLWCLVFFSAFSQQDFNPVQQKIATSLGDYFKLDRENIHLHLNKNTYLNNEQIRFKGYLIEKKYKPTLASSNIYVSIMDANGQKISSFLLYSENGIFEGYIKLNKTFKSGKYFLQAYTHYMNNFAEDESSVTEITILDVSDKNYAATSDDIDYQSASCSFFPEGGTFLEGVSNTIGVKISDCHNRGIAVTDAQVIDSKGVVVSGFSTDAFGYGKFEILNTNRESYKTAYTLGGKRFEAALPLPVSTGISFSIINYMYPNKTVVKLKTNAATLRQIKNTPYNLIFQQNEAVVFAGFAFTDNPEIVLTVPSTEIADGINAVWLIGPNQKRVGERIIYKPYADANKTILNIARKDMDHIEITGSTPIKSGSLSVSVLPSKSLDQRPKRSIQDDLQFNNYLSVPSWHGSYYLTDFSRKKHYELDNFLLSAQSKYDWDTMMAAAPQQKYESDLGLTIKGTLNTDAAVSPEMKINMSSLGLGLNEYTKVNTQKEFFFEHILAQDSTKIYFSVFGKNDKKLDLKIYSQLLNPVRPFLKTFSVSVDKACPEKKTVQETFKFPSTANAVMLDSVNIANKKTKLIYQNRRGNFAARGFKITDEEAASYRDVLHFIETNGFNVTVKLGTTFIEGYTSTPRLRINSPNGIPDPQIGGPAVYIDGNFVQNYDMLRDMSMLAVDEIYINKAGTDISVRGSRGVIQVYTRKNSGIILGNAYNKSQALLVKNGFQRNQPFENPKYDNVRDEGFLKLGTIGWDPLLKTDENGTFRLSIPNLYQSAVTLVIEGLASDGQMISETMTLDTH